MKLDDFNFELPNHLIARYPLPERTASRLMCLNTCTKTITHRHFTDSIKLINPGDLLVFNDTRVIPARLFGVKATGGKVEILVERVLDDRRILAHVKSSKAMRIGSRLKIEEQITVEVLNRHDALFELQFLDERSVFEILETVGHVPLPPYIDRPDENSDWERYQTVYARRKGAVAAPTAGLHFDEALLQQLRDNGVEFAYVTLHVGAGTFQPVRTQDITQHQMHSEYVEVSEQVCRQIKKVKARGDRVIAVGTTSVRSLESASQTGELKPLMGETDLFIYPGYRFQCVDAMLTNFHLPKSTLLMLVCTFGGYDFILQAYREAVEKKYRFFSYGDAMFLEMLES